MTERLKSLMGSIYEFLPNFLSSVQQAANKPGGANGHLGLVMGKLAEISFNLERALECTWPRTLEGEFYCGPYCPKLDQQDDNLYVCFALLH